MTMPHLMNCAHADEGWCLACVAGLHAEKVAWQDRAEVAESHERELRPISDEYLRTTAERDEARRERDEACESLDDAACARNKAWSDLDALRTALCCPAGVDVLARAEAMRAVCEAAAHVTDRWRKTGVDHMEIQRAVGAWRSLSTPGAKEDDRGR